ncbi:MAG: choice-of-anchor J domain-containing protein [Alcanivoracaceae bacterium]|nr:choice-of-anchor J domain-containing protein [Alcanivoracaceae bacterium]
MKNRLLLVLFSSNFIGANIAVAQIGATDQGFDNLENLSPGWVLSNQSSPLGTTGWLQGNADLFVAEGGSGNSYIAANFNNTGGETDNPGIICNYLIMPELGNLASVSFQTRSRIANNLFNIFPDRLYMVYSPTGEINTGNCTDGFGDFTETLLVINPDLTKETSFPEGYPMDNWIQFSSEINGNGRVAFVYYVEQAGFFGINSNYIGIDSIEWELVQPEQP